MEAIPDRVGDATTSVLMSDIRCPLIFLWI